MTPTGVSSLLWVSATPPPPTLVNAGTDRAWTIHLLAPDAVSQAAAHAAAVVVVLHNEEDLHSIRRCRATRSLAHLPIIAVTSTLSDDLTALAFEAGADDVARLASPAGELFVRLERLRRLHAGQADAARRGRDAQLVLELTQTLSSKLDFRDILFHVVKRTAQVARADRCSVILASDGESRGYVVAASDDPALRDRPIDIAKYPEIAQVLETQKPLIIDDARVHPVLEMVREGLPSEGLRSLLLVPVVHERRALGVLVLRCASEALVLRDELPLVQTIAGALAISLRNARLLQGLKEQTAEIASARSAAEERAKVLESYKQIFESLPSGVLVVDRHLEIYAWNARGLEILGAQPSVLQETGLKAIVAPQDHATLQHIEQTLSQGAWLSHIDLQIQRRGTTGVEARTLSLTTAPLQDGGRQHFLLIFSDVTRERAIARELLQTKTFLQSVIDSSADAIISADRRGVIRLFNRAAERLTGIPAEQVVGRKTARELYPPNVAETIMALIRSDSHGKTGRLEGYATEIIAATGEKIPVAVSAALLSQDGEAKGSVGVFKDLREKVELQSRLSQAEAALQLRQRDTMMAQLAGAAAHELNQPLQAILGTCELLARLDPSDPAAERSRVRLQTSAAQMAQIVQKIGHITHYETKSYVGETEIVDLDTAGDW